MEYITNSELYVEQNGDTISLRPKTTVQQVEGLEAFLEEWYAKKKAAEVPNMYVDIISTE